MQIYFYIFSEIMFFFGKAMKIIFLKGGYIERTEKSRDEKNGFPRSQFIAEITAM